MTSARAPLMPDDHGAFADAHELPHRRRAAEQHMVADLDMTAEQHVVGEGDVVADFAVVTDMRADHQEAAVADLRHAAAVLGADVHGDVFADVAVGADHQPGRRRRGT